MNRFLTESMQGFLNGALSSLGILAVLVPVMAFGPDVESYLLPVVSDFKILSSIDHDNYTEYDVQFEKLRSCDPVGVIWDVTDVDGLHNKVLLEVQKTAGSDASRAVGIQKSTGWKVYNKAFPFTSQKLVVYHDCHFGWRTKTEVEVN